MNRLIASKIFSSKVITLSNLRPINSIFKYQFSSNSGDLESKFVQSKENSTKLKADPGNEAKLKLYALYKQATVGPNKTDKPGSFDIVGKYKWAAWSQLGEMSQEEAKKEYIKLIENLEQELGTNK